MFGSLKYGANSYAKVGVETGVISASPHKLIVMLFEGALVAISSASEHMKSCRIAEKGQSISKAISIIDGGLRANLNKKEGGEIAENLDALYEYMNHRLLQANLENNPAILDEVHKLLGDLKSAWDAIDSISAASATADEASSAPSKASVYNFSASTSTIIRA